MSADAGSRTPTGHEQGQLRLGLRWRHAVLQAAQHRQEVTRPKLADRGRELEREPQLHPLVHEVEARRHHTDHLVPDAVDLDRLANDGLTAAEGRAPQLVRQDDDRRTAAARLVAAEPPAALGRHREGLEQLCVHACARRAQRPIEPCEVHFSGHERADDREGLADLGQLEGTRPATPGPPCHLRNRCSASGAAPAGGTRAAAGSRRSPQRTSPCSRRSRARSSAPRSR